MASAGGPREKQAWMYNALVLRRPPGGTKIERGAVFRLQKKVGVDLVRRSKKPQERPD